MSAEATSTPITFIANVMRQEGVALGTYVGWARTLTAAVTAALLAGCGTRGSEVTVGSIASSPENSGVAGLLNAGCPTVGAPKPEVLQVFGAPDSVAAERAGERWQFRAGGSSIWMELLNGTVADWTVKLGNEWKPGASTRYLNKAAAQRVGAYLQQRADLPDAARYYASRGCFFAGMDTTLALAVAGLPRQRLAEDSLGVSRWSFGVHHGAFTLGVASGRLTQQGSSIALGVLGEGIVLPQ